MEESSTNSIVRGGSHTRRKRQKSRKKDVHITLDKEVVGVMERMNINKSEFFNRVARWVFLGEEIPEIVVRLEWCGGRDLNPGRRLGRPAS